MTTAAASPGHIDIGKVLSDTADVYKKSFSTVWIIALILMIPVAILGYFASEGWLINLIYAISSLIASLWLSGALVRVVQDVEADGKVDASVGDILKSITPRIWPLFLLGIVVGILLLIGFVLFIIPGIFLALMWAVAVPVLVAEEKGVFASLSRSGELTNGNRWRLLGLLIVVYILLLIIFVIVGALASIGPVVAFIVILASAIIIYPYISIIAAVVYYELLEAHGEAKPGPGVPTMAAPSGGAPA